MAVVQLVVVMVYRDLADSLKIVFTTKAMEHNSPDLVVIEEVLKLWSNGLLSTFDYLLWSCQLL